MAQGAVQGNAWVYGNDVNTDVIFPGKYTYTLRGRDEIAAHALEDLDPRFATSVAPGDIIIAGRNWGCGSSREQAATCLVYCGVGAVIAASFGRIFYRNAINNGLPVIVCPDVVGAVRAGERIAVDLDRSVITTEQTSFLFSPLPPKVRQILAVGGLIPYVQKQVHAAARQSTGEAQ